MQNLSEIEKKTRILHLFFIFGANQGENLTLLGQICLSSKKWGSWQLNPDPKNVLDSIGSGSPRINYFSHVQLASALSSVQTAGGGGPALANPFLGVTGLAPPTRAGARQSAPTTPHSARITSDMFQAREIATFFLPQRDSVTRFFASGFFHESSSPKPGILRGLGKTYS